jgi:putative redox protein
VTKEMSADAPRRIVRLVTTVWLPFAKSKDPQGVLEKAALNCPMHHSLHPAIERPITFHWAE